MRKILTAFLLALFILLTQTNFTLAQESTISAKLTVDHIAGGIEKIVEKVNTFLKFNPKDKLEYYQYLVEKRLAEFEYVMRDEDFDRLGEVVDRYNTYLGVLTDYAVKNIQVTKKAGLLNMMNSHNVLIKQRQAKLERDSGWWIYLQWMIDSQTIASNKITNIN